jgi:DNA helicase-2/ATP-dependent DNA helicase PcrA
MTAPSSFTLSPEQKKVIAYRGGDLQVIACAGAGKTESISRRIASLICDDGVEPAAIVAFTFTERAAAEMKERVMRRVGERKGRTFLDRLSPMFVGTIHSYCFRILQSHVPKYGNYDVLDEHRHAGLLTREFFALELYKYRRKGAESPTERWIRTVDVIGNELLDQARLTGSVAESYRAYREMLDRYHSLTFSLIIQTAVEALGDRAVFARVHGPLRHLIVDEYQDINPAQQRLIELLARRPVHLCVVGDDDQCIYQWRGSDVANIRTFANRRGAKTVPLEENRRSRPGIIATANEFSTTIPGRLKKKMQAVRKPAKHEVVPWCAETPEEEAERIVETIRRLHDSRGYRYADIGVLFRSVRTSAPPLIAACGRARIPVAAGGRSGLFLQPEINLFGKVFAWFVHGEWQDERYQPRRAPELDELVRGFSEHFNGGTTIRGLRKYFEDWQSHHLRHEAPVSLVGDFYRLLYRVGAYRIDVGTALGSARFGALGRFSRVLADFEHVFRRGRYVVDETGSREFRGGRDRGKEYFEDLHRYLLFYARGAYEEFEGELSVVDDAVDILTIHQAKGLEWPVVFVPAVTSRRFPSSLTGRHQEWLLDDDVFPAQARARYEGSEAEERRLFYVAITRARDAVYVSYFKRITQAMSPSPFLREVAGSRIPKPAVLPLPGALEATPHNEPRALEVTFSDLALFEDCGYRYRLANRLGFEQEIAPELGYGKAIHHVLRRVAETVQETREVPDAKALERLVQEEFYLPLANKPAFEQMSRAGRRLVRTYVERHGDELKRVWAVERPFELHLPEGIIAGRADVILDEENGRIGSLAIVDYKTATTRERDERYRRQLAIYAAAGRGEGLTVEGAYLHDLDAATRDGVDISAASTDAAVGLAAGSVKAIRAGAFEPSPAKPKCAACDYHRVCCHTAHEPDD